ncbi:MFS family permease [Kineococcus radiotolerans]|uniref:MFS family permease n=1 Tax=Kineococcus radiotolerans TaxID=131568 RepID=A0A7W4XYM8_KINRA|nr:MFS transporter [Kineococcus radiotolerans]MBB2902385.1 MFS family permease [Kineococcus radiotolerans]
MSSPRRHRLGFWIVTAAFATAMAFPTVPTPLWALYRERDGLPTAVVTVAFAAYAAGVAVALFTAGHLSDHLGRRRVLVPALALEAVAALALALTPDVVVLVAARVATGLAVGALTPTATAHLAELHGRTASAHPATGAVVATAANLGGLGLGSLAAGFLVGHLGDPLRVPHLVFLVLLLLATAALALVPETVQREHRPYRVQRIAVPAAARGRYLAAALASFGLFSVMGLFSSLAPAVLASLGHPGPVAGGATAFSVFAAAALSQVLLARLAPHHQVRLGLVLTAAGVVVLGAGVLLAAVVPFAAGGVVAGAGVGVLLKGALSTATALAPAGSRGEAAAGIFLAGYLGMAVPALAVGLSSSSGVPFGVSVPVLAVVVLVVLGAVAVALHRNPAPADAPADTPAGTTAPAAHPAPRVRA